MSSGTYEAVDLVYRLHAIVVVVEHEVTADLHKSYVGHEVRDQALLWLLHHLFFGESGV